MDNFEMTKIAGAVLAALLLIVGTRTIIAINAEGATEKPGYTLPAAVAGGESKGAGGAKAADAGEGSAVPLLAKAKVDAGKTIFKKCQSCHSLDKGKNGVGPSLYGVVDRPKASEAGYKYDDALKNKGGNWTFEDLSSFLHKPKDFVPGTKMSFPGIPSAQDRADVIAYLATVGDKPVPLPKAAAAAPDANPDAKEAAKDGKTPAETPPK